MKRDLTFILFCVLFCLFHRNAYQLFGEIVFKDINCIGEIRPCKVGCVWFCILMGVGRVEFNGIDD